jgi:hypothetical protein
VWKKDVGPFILLSFVGRIHLTLESFTFHQKTFVGLYRLKEVCSAVRQEI